MHVALLYTCMVTRAILDTLEIPTDEITTTPLPTPSKAFWPPNLRGDAFAQRPAFHGRLVLHVLNLLRQRVLVHGDSELRVNSRTLLNEAESPG